MVRVGLGIDVHAFDEQGELILGGVIIPGSPGLVGHSDADVLTHALIDAILGACCLGDLGKHFPDTDDEYKDISSLVLLERAVLMAADHGYRIVNADAVIICERPKVAPFRCSMAETLSTVMEIGVDDVNIKATTTEGLGFTGRGEGIAAQAVVLVETV